jgi:hypothetical protein
MQSKSRLHLAVTILMVAATATGWYFTYQNNGLLREIHAKTR